MNIPEFKNKAIYEQVFYHRSYLNEAKSVTQSNERLEFLGDAILTYVVSSYIYRNFTHYNEGKLTSMRSVLTNTETFYYLGKKLGLGQRLKMSKGELASGGRENKSILANTYEALVGGLYLDQGIEKTSEFIQETILDHIDEFVGKQGMKDSKSKLQELTQEKEKVSPEYKIVAEEGPDHDKLYTVGVFLNEKLLAKGRGKSKQEAEKNAALKALSQMS